MTTDEDGQQFSTIDTEEFSQFTGSVACREYILPRDESLKGWIRRNTKSGTVLEGTTCCLFGRNGVQVRIESMNKDHSHSWDRISHVMKKVKILNNKEQENNEEEILGIQFEEYHLLQNNYSFNARPHVFELKNVITVISPGGDFSDLI